MKRSGPMALSGRAILIWKRTLVLPLLVTGVLAYCLGQTTQEKAKALFNAVQEGNLKQVLALLDGGIDVNCRDTYNCTPLIVAVKYDQLEIARALCDKGADVNTTSKIEEDKGEYGFTPLQWAAWRCNSSMAELLISKGASPGQRDKSGTDTALLIAARRNCISLAKLLIEKGASVNDVAGGDTALNEAVSAGYLDLADYLIKHGADLGTENQAGYSMLCVAASRQSLAEVRYFHEKGLPIDGATFFGLDNTVESRYILEYLIEHGGKANLKSPGGTTPLMNASLKGANIAAEMLIAHGAIVNDANDRGKTPLLFACQGYRDDEAELVVPNWTETVKLLLDKGAQVNVQGQDGITPLMEVAQRGSLEIIKMLLEHGAQLNAQDESGWTPLMYAATVNKVEVIRLLAERGANLNVRNKKGMTVLAMVKERTHLAEAYAVLKSLGAEE